MASKRTHMMPCQISQQQTVNQEVGMCPLTKFEGGLRSLKMKTTTQLARDIALAK